MPVTIRNASRDVLYETGLSFNLQDPNSRAFNEYDYMFDYDFGNARFREMQFDGFAVSYGTVHLHEHVTIESNDIVPMVGLHFMLQGELSAQIEGMHKLIQTSHLQHNMVYNGHAAETLTIYPQQEMKIFGLGFSRNRFVELAADNGSVLDKFAEDVANHKPVALGQGYAITPRMLQLIEEVRHCHFTGGLKKLFLQSKAIELLALQCEQVEREGMRSPEALRISRSEEERIYHARDLLLEHAHDPLSLGELARKAGLNEFKLKQGFKKVFDNTVFGYLSDHRLDQAQHMIREGRLSLTDIAETLGYSSLQHFSNAFRKKFGLSPSRLRAR